MKRYSFLLDTLKSENRFRVFPPHRHEVDYIDLSSNDYLGLRKDETKLRNVGITASNSSSASRLLAVDQENHNALESDLSNLYNRHATLFNSGYHANTGIIGALGNANVLFLADKLVHASIIDGLKLSQCDFKRFPHNNIEAVKKILRQKAQDYEMVWIIVESIYSMDGDVAPLRELVELKKEFTNIFLYVDEAHGFGVRGTKGLGLCEETDTIKDIDIIIGTFGKAACSIGAFAIAEEELTHYIRNYARSLIFSTALPPYNVAWSRQVISELVNLNHRRQRLCEISAYFRDRLNKLGYVVPSGDTPIIPLITGSAESALDISAVLEKENILALPIRRPTVPAGGERIRFSLNATLSDEEINKVLKVMAQLTNLVNYEG